MQNYGYTPYPYAQPYGYSPYGQRFAPQQPQMQQPSQPLSQPTQQPQMQYETPIQDVRFVTSEEAKAFIVMPNSKALLIDKSGMAYLKTADNMGQSQTQCFRFEAVNADGTPVTPAKTTETVNFDDFVKKDDLQKFGFATVEQHRELAQKLAQIQARLEMPKQNVGTSKQ